MKQILSCLAAALAFRAILYGANTSEQHDAVAAAYQLRTPDKANRFASGWAFAKEVYERFEGLDSQTNVVVFAYDRAQDEAGLDDAIREVAAILEPGDIVASDGTNVCFYAGDVYGDGRGKVLAVNTDGFVGEWDVGTYLFNWPHNQKKLAVAEKFVVLRPLNDPSVEIAKKRRFPKGEGEKISDERVRAVVATAWAHYLKNECTQYDSIALVSDGIRNGSYDLWSRKDYRLPIEAGTPDRTYYSVCSSFAYEVYYGAFGYGLGEDHKGYASYQLTQDPPPDILVYRHEKGKDDKPDEMVLKEARAALRPGDVISYANVRKKKAGHVMLYIGEVDGVGTILHSTGQKFNFDERFDKVELEGTVIKNDVDDALFTKGSPRYLLKYDQFVILRPLKRADLRLTPTGKARATHPKFRYDRRVAGGIYGSVVEGGHLRYSVEVFNADLKPCDATVRETLPEGTELVACSNGATTDGTTAVPLDMSAVANLVWPVELQPGERRTVEWTVRAKVGTAGSDIVAGRGSAGGIPSNRLVTQVVACNMSVADAFRWADCNLTDAANAPVCRVRGWCGGYKTDKPPREERVRETRSRDLMPGDVVAAWTLGTEHPSVIWVKDDVGLLRRTSKGFERVPESEVSALLASDVFCAFRPACARH